MPTNYRLSADASDISTTSIDSASNTMILAIVIPLVALLLIATVVYFFYCWRAVHGGGRTFPLIDYFYKFSDKFANNSPLNLEDEMDGDVKSRPTSLVA